MAVTHQVGLQRGSCRGVRCIWVAGLVSLSAGWNGASQVRAEDGNYVMPGGRKIKMTRSTTEVGVTLRDVKEKDASAKRLSDAKVGVMEDLRHAPDANVKMLRVEQMTKSKMDALRADPDIAEVRPVYRFETSQAPVISTGTVVVKVRKELSNPQRNALWQEFKIAQVAEQKGQPNVYILTLAADGDDLDVAERLSGDARVLWANPNLRFPTVKHQVTPTDPFFSRQWHLNNTGQLGGVVDADIDALEAWAITTGACTHGTGECVLFGMFDDSCDVDHEDLRDNYVGFGQDATLTEGAEGYNDPRPKQPEERHGTPVMGLAVAAGNTLGGRGVAFNAEFTAARGLGSAISNAQLAQTYSFARENGVDVHINSWGFPLGIPDPPVIVDAIELAFREGRNRGDLDGDGIDDPLGMVILFASGNDGTLVDSGFELSTLPQVIGVGASNDRDTLSVFSNFGPGIDLTAPSNDFRTAQILTTDNTDGPEVIDPGYNVGGFFNGTDFLREADTEGKYTQFFGGTSAACPIAAGVAGLMLSVNPLLTATDVRLILEHTADRIDQTNAEYDGTTSRSLTHGYGRINAGGSGDKLGSVEAALESLSNGGFTWPDRPAEVRTEGIFLRWRQNVGTSEFLTVVSDNPFSFIPEDGACYDSRQSNCLNDVNSLPAGVEVLGVGCALTCDTTTAVCTTGAQQCVAFTSPTAGGRKFFAVYARNAIGRYSFGVAADSQGNVLDDGDIASESAGTGGSTPPQPGPAVTINVTPLEGTSPLTVNFAGNAVSVVPIDESKAIWDFDQDDSNPVDATSRTTTHIYLVPSGLARTFMARLTLFDTDGRAGFAEVGIQVQGTEEGTGNDPVGSGDLQIRFGLPNSPGSDLSEGPSPLTLLLTVEANDLQGTVQSVVWDLGDGSRASGLSVPHTYENTSDANLRFPVTVTITTISAGGATVASTGTRFLTVTPGLPVVDPGDPNLPGTTPGGEGGAVAPCAGLGLIPLGLMLVGLTLLRRRR